MSETSSGSSDGSSSASKSEAPAKDAGKSARESVGGTKEVHYGYFSSVRDKSYADGWDAIWSGKDNKKAAKPAARARASTAKKAKSATKAKKKPPAKTR